MVKNGYEVEIITHHDKGLKKEERQGELFIKCLAYLDRTVTKGKIGKLKAYLLFLKESVNYCKYFNILHCNDINMLPVAVIIKKYYNKDVKIVYDAHKTIDDDTAVIVFMGYGPLEESIVDIAKDYDNIYFHQAASPDVLLDYTSSADFGISTIEDSCLSYRYCLPNKMFEYLMAEIPVIDSSLFEMKRLMEHSHVGVVAKENTPNGLSMAIKKLYC